MVLTIVVRAQNPPGGHVVVMIVVVAAGMVDNESEVVVATVEVVIVVNCVSVALVAQLVDSDMLEDWSKVVVAGTGRN